MNPGNADWWWMYALDGIVGGILGGLVTGLAVWLTLRHERRSRRDDLRRQELDEVRHVVTRVLGKALEVNRRTHDVNGSETDVRDGLAELEHEIKLSEPLLIRALDLGPTLVMTGAVIGRVTRPIMNLDQASRLAFSVVRRCQNWLRDPLTYDGSTQDRAERQAYGKTVIEGLLGTWIGPPPADNRKDDVPGA